MVFAFCPSAPGLPPLRSCAATRTGWLQARTTVITWCLDRLALGCRKGGIRLQPSDHRTQRRTQIVIDNRRKVRVKHFSPLAARGGRGVFRDREKSVV